MIKLETTTAYDVKEAARGGMAAGRGQRFAIFTIF